MARLARQAGLALSLFALAGGGLWAETRAERSPSRDVQGQDMDALRGYSDRLGKGLLRDYLGLDLDALALQWDPSNLSFRSSSPSAQGGAGPKSLSAPPSAMSDHLSLKLEQVDDLRRLTQDLRDIPFGLSVQGTLSLGASLATLQTSLWVPFSWRDQWRAEAELPFRLDDVKGRRYSLRSDYRNTLGLSDLEAGLGTDLNWDSLGIWGLDYDFHRRFGQGSDEAIHWLKLSRQF